MHNSYEDIRERIEEEPVWFDEYAVPRYSQFTPRYIANIYAIECALVEIACQECDKEFLVAFSSDTGDSIIRNIPPVSIANHILRGTLNYGDPPNACGDNCAAGATMNSAPQRVVEYWKKLDFEWVRDPSLEVNVLRWE